MNIQSIHSNTQSTADQIHGHEVLEMMIVSDIRYSINSLEAAIHTKFGCDARFYICSGGGMTAAQLIKTLWDKGKFTGTPEAFTFDISKRCQH